MGTAKQQTYWRSLNELAQNEEYRKFVEREFPENATELTDGVSRRNFLQIMGASIALAGFTACRKPVQKIMPYTLQPEHVIPGIPLFYASALPFRGSLSGVVIETHEGRPTKIEGNDIHPESKGRTGIRQQSAILDLYDPDRSRNVRNNGQISSWDSFVAFCADHFSANGRRIAFLSEANSSPTLNQLKAEAISWFPQSRWVTFEPFGEENILNGTKMTFGQRLRPVYQLDRARVVLSLDDDFMQESDNHVRYIGDYAENRELPDKSTEPIRLYVAESNYTVTGSNADHRLRIKSSDILPFACALAAELSRHVSGLGMYAAYKSNYRTHKWMSALVKELLQHPGNSLVTAGAGQPPELHATVAAINLALENAGQTVDYLKVPHTGDQDQNSALRELTEAMHQGDVDTLVLLGTNPVANAPADLAFGKAMEQVSTCIHLSSHYDETSLKCQWHVNRTHFLESWGDGYSFTGIPSIIQPVIMPLFGAKSEIELLHAIVHGRDKEGYELVRRTWKGMLGANFESKWQQVLHDGLRKDHRFETVGVQWNPGFSAIAESFLLQLAGDHTTGSEQIELVIKPDPFLHDGRFANNGWLQELPDPMTKVTWDNVAILSPVTAERIGISPVRKFGDPRQEIIRITTENGASVEIAAWVLPGHADNSITLYAGYGRSNSGRVGNGTGVDVWPLRTTISLLYHRTVQVSVAGQTYDIACTQDHHSLEGRPHVQDADLEYYRKNPTFAQDAVYVPGTLGGKRQHPISLFDDKVFPDHEPQWGMTIDLNRCVGCGVCTIACQAENNIPVIGKREVRRGREMHWIRTDRYFSGDERGNPKVMHQPVPCMHCENAPCEQVCPVSATTHSDDGLNQMTYSRCIGTRYCANNCPYKVRRFNFFNYSKSFLTGGDDPEVIQMAMNPDVTIRFRGVMEKCTFCVQRISRAKIDTKKETGDSIKPPDGSVITACQQACPANAIQFGDLTDKNSRVSMEKSRDRNYMMLEEINVRPRTSYLARIRNPNKEMS